MNSPAAPKTQGTTRQSPTAQHTQDLKKSAPSSAGMTNEFDVLDHPMLIAWFDSLALKDPLGVCFVTGDNLKLFHATWGAPDGYAKRGDSFEYWHKDHLGISIFIYANNASTYFRVKYFGSKASFLQDEKMGSYLVTYMDAYLRSFIDRSSQPAPSSAATEEDRQAPQAQAPLGAGPHVLREFDFLNHPMCATWMREASKTDANAICRITDGRHAFKRMRVLPIWHRLYGDPVRVGDDEVWQTQHMGKIIRIVMGDEGTTFKIQSLTPQNDPAAFGRDRFCGFVITAFLKRCLDS